MYFSNRVPRDKRRPAEDLTRARQPKAQVELMKKDQQSARVLLGTRTKRHFIRFGAKSPAFFSLGVYIPYKQTLILL